MSEGRGRDGGQRPPGEPGQVEPPDEAPGPRPPPRKATAASSKATGRAKAARPAKSAAGGKDGPKPRKAAPAGAKKAPAKRTVAKRTVAKKAAAMPDTVESPPTRPPPRPTPPRPPPPPPAPPPPPPAAPSWAPPAWTPAPPSYAPPTSPGIDSLAITAMVLGIVAVPLFIFFVPAVLAIVLGLLGRRNVKREPAKGGKGMATAGVVLGTLSLLGAIVFIVGLALSDDGSDDGVSYALLQAGNCYDMDFYDERDVDLRLCSDEHYREAFAVLDHPAPPGTEYPGREGLRRYAQRECAARFPGYVGRAYEDSRLRIVVVFPPRDEWEEENLRHIVCAAAGPNDEDLTRSVRDSGV